MAKKSKNNVKNLAKRRNEMISKGTYYQASYVEKKIGNGAPPRRVTAAIPWAPHRRPPAVAHPSAPRRPAVGSGKAYYQSGR